MSIKTLLFGLLFLTVEISYSQYDPDYNSEDSEELSDLDFKDRLYTGGNFWGQIGTYTSLEIAPILGYRLTEEFSAGVGMKYNYYRYNPQFSPAISTSIYGGSVFARYILLEQFIAHAEIETLNVELFNTRTAGERRWVPIGLVGGGYSNNGLQILLLYDLIDDRNNPYFGTFGSDSRVYLRVGFLFNL